MRTEPASDCHVILVDLDGSRRDAVASRPGLVAEFERVVDGIIFLDRYWLYGLDEIGRLVYRRMPGMSPGHPFPA